MKNKSDQNSERSLLDVFLLTSQSIDNNLEFANQIIREEGIDTDDLQQQGIAFIKSLQKKQEEKPIELFDLVGMIKRLTKAGIPKSLLEQKIIPSIMNSTQNITFSIQMDAIASSISKIFGLNKKEIIDSSAELNLDFVPAKLAMFKAPVRANLSQIKAYSHYAFYLAGIVSKSYKPEGERFQPEDTSEFMKDYFRNYDQIDLRSLINYAWELGFCVLPLNDSGIFHGACWNIEGRRVIVLKQKSKHHARWIFDLLHEIYHALAHLDEPNSVVIETQEIAIDNDTLEEKEANTFAQQVLFNGKAQEIINSCIEFSNGRIERLKDAVRIVALRENIREDILANLVAYRLSLEQKEWWSVATSFQISSPDPLEVAKEILITRTDFQGISLMDQSLLQMAISHN